MVHSTISVATMAVWRGLLIMVDTRITPGITPGKPAGLLFPVSIRHTVLVVVRVDRRWTGGEGYDTAPGEGIPIAALGRAKRPLAALALVTRRRNGDPHQEHRPCGRLARRLRRANRLKTDIFPAPVSPRCASAYSGSPDVAIHG